MSRLVLLGLEDNDVDVLSRIANMSPRPEVVVVHPNPKALIHKLAKVAEIPTSFEPLQARSDDVVVVALRGEDTSAFVDHWRREGARIIGPESLELELGFERGDRSLDRDRNSVAELKQSFEKTASSPPGRIPAALSVSEPPTTENAPLEESPPMNRPSSPPAAIWETPEATFRYLIEQAAGPQREVTLWWDGDADTWVPWLWTGTEPGPAHEGLETALAIPSSLGRFRLTGVDEVRSELNVPALTRVAEDAALRDLLTWRRAADDLKGAGKPDAEAGAPELARWADPVLAALSLDTAFFWRRTGSDWTMVHAQGKGIEFKGSLRLHSDLFHVMFALDEAGWKRWEPAPDLLLLARVHEEDPRWPLRLRRVERALAGETGSW